MTKTFGSAAIVLDPDALDELLKETPPERSPHLVTPGDKPLPTPPGFVAPSFGPPGVAKKKPERRLAARHTKGRGPKRRRRDR